MTKNFKEYLTESQKVFKTRIKTVNPTDAKFMEKLEKFLQRYNLISISKPSKTMLQRRPLDFPEVQNAEVYIIDCVFASPVSSYVLKTELQNYMIVPGNTIVVRNENEPVELNHDVINQTDDIQAQADKKDLNPDSLLSTDSNYHASEFTADAQNYFGNSYTNRLLKALNDDSELRKQQKIDPPAPIFGWLDMPDEPQEPVQPPEDFNADVDALKGIKIEKQTKDAKVPTAHGNFQSAGDRVKKDYKTNAGKVSTLTSKTK